MREALWLSSPSFLMGPRADPQKHKEPLRGSLQAVTCGPGRWPLAGGRDSVTASVRRVGDAVLGLVCLLLLLLLRLMRAHAPPVHPNTPPGVRLSLGLVWTATTGEGLVEASPTAGPHHLTGAWGQVLGGATWRFSLPVRAWFRPGALRSSGGPAVQWGGGHGFALGSSTSTLSVPRVEREGV